MKKIISLLITLSICLSLICINTASVSAETKTYSIGETWVVDGEWEFTITEVKLHNLCNSYLNEKYGYSNQQVVAISYTYKNIGYEDELWMSLGTFNVYDGTGEAAEEYSCSCNIRKYPSECVVGTKSSATDIYILNNPSNSIMIYGDKYPSKGGSKQSASFNIGIGQKANIPNSTSSVPAIESVIPTYSVGQTWKVDGEWEFSITGIKEHKLCNSYLNEKYGYSNQQVVAISYTYKNIGYEDELWMSLGTFEVYDGSGEAAEEYSCSCNIRKYPDECVVGTKSSATDIYILNNPSNSIMIYGSKYPSKGGSKQSAAFKINLGNNAPATTTPAQSTQPSVSQTVTTPTNANSGITVTLNGKALQFDVQPQLINSRTMVPLRAIFEALGATVNWNGDTQTVTSSKGNTSISLTINSSTMYVNGSPITLDSPACIVDGRTLVPVRAISEAYGVNVEWQQATQTVVLTEQKIVDGDKAFDTVKNYIISTGIKDDEYEDDIIYEYEKRVNNGTLSAMYRPKKDWLRFVYTIAENDCGYENPRVIFTIYRSADTAFVEAYLHPEGQLLTFGTWSLEKTYKKSQISKNMDFVLDNSTAFNVNKMPSDKKLIADDFVTENAQYLFEQVNKMLGNVSLSLTDLGFSNY